MSVCVCVTHVYIGRVVMTVEKGIQDWVFPGNSPNYGICGAHF